MGKFVPLPEVRIMNPVSGRKLVAALSLSFVACFVLDGTLAESRPTSSAQVTGQETQSAAPTQNDKSQWRKLQRHMSKDDVRKLLGEPRSISVSRYCEAWAYIGSGSVTFDSKGRLDYWLEP